MFPNQEKEGLSVFEIRFFSLVWKINISYSVMPRGRVGVWVCVCVCRRSSVCVSMKRAEEQERGSEGVKQGRREGDGREREKKGEKDYFLLVFGVHVKWLFSARVRSCPSKLCVSEPWKHCICNKINGNGLPDCIQ